jgi:hypothetical protein
LQTTTIDGRTVNYIVRVESGTIDESIYRIAILDDPANPIRNPWSAGGKKPGPGWNGKLSFPFGGGCGPAFRSGSNAVTSALSNDPLSLGFAVAFGTRNTLGTGCNFVVSAETMAMVKEYFVEHYGVPKFTIGSGGSGARCSSMHRPELSGLWTRSPAIVLGPGLHPARRDRLRPAQQLLRQPHQSGELAAGALEVDATRRGARSAAWRAPATELERVRAPG